MKKGVVIGIIIVIVIIGTISTYSMINQNSNTDEIITPDVIPEPTGVNHSIELTEGLTMTVQQINVVDWQVLNMKIKLLE